MAERVIAVNLTASFVVGQRAARAMVARGEGGVILFTASISSLGGRPSSRTTTPPRPAIANLVKTMALELVKHGIRVNCVSPGPADTQQSVDLVGEELMDKWRGRAFPSCRWAARPLPTTSPPPSPSSRPTTARYITGINLVVDGGLTAHAYSVPSSRSKWIRNEAHG